MQIPLRIYSADGVQIGEFGEKRRIPIHIDDVPIEFTHALLAAEDDNFENHPGIDIKSLIRAALQLATTGHIQSGGSTITMQVAKNIFLNNKRTFARKFSEILLALKIEKELSKQQILELYMNKIYLGNRAYGVQTAANIYYDRNLQELSLAQMAMLAGLPKAPSKFNPIANPERAMIRRNWILGRMKTLGYIDETAYQQALAEPNTARLKGLQIDHDAPYAAEMARQETVERFGNAAYEDGFVVHTTINSQLQATAQKAVIDGLTAYDQRHGYRGPEQNLGNRPKDQWGEHLRKINDVGGLTAGVIVALDKSAITILNNKGEKITINWATQKQVTRRFINENSMAARPNLPSDLWKPGDVVRLRQDDKKAWIITQIPHAQAALVSLNPDDGAILAIVGGFDFYASKFNRASQAQRQPGSNFKPFIYAAALSNGFTAATLINDAPIVFEDKSQDSGVWRPENDSGEFYGPTRIREALYKSRNLVSIRLLQELGIDTAISYLRQFGFDDRSLPPGLSLALGTGSVTPLQLANAYASIANGGYRIDHYLIREVRNGEDQVVYQANPTIICRENCEVSALSALEQESGNQTSPADTPAPPPMAKRIIEERVAFIIDDILKDVIRKGTGTAALALKRGDIAGKTGTTNGPTDAWFSGYNPDVVTTTWLGFDKNENLGRMEYGGSAALPIWMNYMRVALKDKAERYPSQPPGLVSVLINPQTGERAAPGDPDAIFEYFKEEEAPADEVLDQEVPTDTALPEELF